MHLAIQHLALLLKSRKFTILVIILKKSEWGLKLVIQFWEYKYYVVKTQEINMPGRLQSTGSQRATERLHFTSLHSTIN